jgi:hypothetical protein
MFRKILNFCLNEPARSAAGMAAGRITDGARKTLGVSSPCLLDCLWFQWPARLITSMSIVICPRALGEWWRGTSEAQLNSNFTQLTNHHLRYKTFRGKNKITTK